MTTPASPPSFRGRPVILVHLVTDLNSNMAWCADEEYIPELANEYPGVPRILCPACARAPKGYAVEVPDATVTE